MAVNEPVPVLVKRLERECDMRADDTMKLCKEIDALNAKIAELRELVKDRLDWYTRSGRTKTLLSGVWINRARKALGLTGDRSE